MGMYARVAGPNVLEFRELDLELIPEHKRNLWLPVSYEGSGEVEATVVGDSSVTVSRRERDLETVKSEICRKIETDAEAVRSSYLTQGTGKAMEYMEAKAQARDVIALGRVAANSLPQNGDAHYPILAASVPDEAETLYAAAELVIVRAGQFGVLGGIIKRKAIEAKKSVNAAVDCAAARAAYAAFRFQ